MKLDRTWSLAALLLLATAHNAHAAPDDDAELECAAASSKGVAALVKATDKIVAKCVKRARAGNLPEYSCTSWPYAGEFGESYLATFNKIAAKVELACAADCPDCYDDCAITPVSHLLPYSLVGLANELLYRAHCDDSASPDGTSALENKCESSAGKALAKLVGSESKCYDKCFALVVDGRLPAGACAPGSSDAALTTCIQTARAKAVTAIDKSCAVAGGVPECFTAAFDSGAEWIGREAVVQRASMEETYCVETQPVCCDVSPTCWTGMTYAQCLLQYEGTPFADGEVCSLDGCGPASTASPGITCSGLSGDLCVSISPALAEYCVLDGGDIGVNSVCLPSGEPQHVGKNVFVTHGTYLGNLGGLTGADAICQYQAGLVGLSGTYKAWLSDTFTTASSRLTHSTSPYRNVLGGKIADDFSDLVDGTLDAPIQVTQAGDTILSDSVWTATGIYGTSGFFFYCNEWTGTSPSDLPQVGSTASSSAAWTAAGTGACNVARRLYCFEQ